MPSPENAFFYLSPPLSQTQDVNQRAYSVIKRIADKLSGTDFRSTIPELPSDDTPFSVAKQARLS